MGSKKDKKEMVKAAEQSECVECTRNLRIIQHYHTIIDRKSLAGMQKTGDRVAVFIAAKNNTVEFRAIQIQDLPKIERWDEELQAGYEETLKDLETGDTMVIVATANRNHIGIYKLTPGNLN